MKRDKREFHDWLIFNSLESFVEFHQGINFDCKQGDIILFDEADELILAGPAKFMETF